MACVVKKNDLYYIKYYDLDGKQKWKATGTKNKREANEAAKRLAEELKFQKKVRSETDTAPSDNISLSVLLEDYRNHLHKRAEQGNLSKQTVTNNIIYLNLFQAFLVKQELIEKTARHLNKSVMGQFLEFLLKYKPPVKPFDKLTATGIGMRFQAVGRFLAYIADEQTFNIEIDPKIVNIALPKSEKPKNSIPKTLTKEQVEYLIELPAILKANSAERDSMVFLTLFNTGLRSGELKTLKVQDIDFKKGEMSIVGKGNKFRTVPLTDKLFQALKQYVQGKKPDALVFSGEKGAFSREFLKNLFRKYEPEFRKRFPEAAHLHPHMSRHTAVTLMLEAGIPVEVVKEIAGHAKISTTMIYTHVTRNRMKEEIRKYGV